MASTLKWPEKSNSEASWKLQAATVSAVTYNFSLTTHPMRLTVKGEANILSPKGVLSTVEFTAGIPVTAVNKTIVYVDSTTGNITTGVLHDTSDTYPIPNNLSVNNIIAKLNYIVPSAEFGALVEYEPITPKVTINSSMAQVDDVISISTPNNDFIIDYTITNSDFNSCLIAINAGGSLTFTPIDEFTSYPNYFISDLKNISKFNFEFQPDAHDIIMYVAISIPTENGLVIIPI